MLRKNLLGALAFAVLTSPIAGCSDPDAEQDRPKVIDSVQVELPFVSADARFDNNPPLAINASGSFALNGEALSAEELSAYLAEQQDTDPDRLSVQIDGEAKFGNVIGLLSSLAEDADVYVAQTTGGKFKREQVALTNPVRKRLFVGTIGNYHLPLIAGYLADENKCVLLLGGGGGSILAERPLDMSEVDQVANKFLDRYVEHHGGTEKVADKPEVISTLVGRIQAQADTPWRCVAAPMERVSQAGWPVLQYELVP